MSAGCFMETAASGRPTPQEEVLISLQSGDFDRAVSHVRSGFEIGRTPSFLSVIRPDLLLGFAEAWQAGDTSTLPIAPEKTKREMFSDLLPAAESGDPAAISTLPKLITSPMQMRTALELTLDYAKTVTEWRTERPYLQYLGTFDPQHIGHRIAIASSLEVAGPRSSSIVHVMGQHPLKPELETSYVSRFRQSERRLLTSPLLDNARVTQVDVPGGLGLGTIGAEQLRLLADASGDAQLRWLIGSDVLLREFKNVRLGRTVAKSLIRLAEPRLHAYVIHRKEDDPTELDDGIDYLSSKFGTEVTVVEELPYDCAPASSTRIRELRTQGRGEEADHMELYELI